MDLHGGLALVKALFTLTHPLGSYLVIFGKTYIPALTRVYVSRF